MRLFKNIVLILLLLVLLPVGGCFKDGPEQPEAVSAEAEPKDISQKDTAATVLLGENETSVRLATPLESSYSTDEMYSNATKFAKPDCSRLAGVMRRAMAGEDITVAVLGGSITQGTAASRQDNCYASIMYRWWKATFPESSVTLVNAGIGGTDSYLGVHRVQKDLLDYNPDFVIVEYSVNESNGMTAKTSYDNLVHRILGSESAPAVMLLYMTMEDGTSAQATHALIGFNYQLPQLSYHDAVMPELEAGTFTWQDISPDNIHPNDRGHALCGELICRYLNAVYVNLDTYGEPTGTVSRLLTKDVYSTAFILDRSNIGEDCTLDGFLPECTAWSEFDKGWTTKSGGRLAFTVNASRIGILYGKNVSSDYGKALVYVDGTPVMTLDGFFKDGWGNYGSAEAVFSADTAAEHLVEIYVDTEADRTGFDIYGILVSE